MFSLVIIFGRFFVFHFLFPFLSLFFTITGLHFFHLVYGLLLLSLLFWSCSFSYSCLPATTPKWRRLGVRQRESLMAWKLLAINRHLSLDQPSLENEHLSFSHFLLLENKQLQEVYREGRERKGSG